MDAGCQRPVDAPTFMYCNYINVELCLVGEQHETYINVDNLRLCCCLAAGVAVKTACTRAVKYSQRPAWTLRGSQRPAGTVASSRGQSGTVRDSHGQSGTVRDSQGRSGTVKASPPTPI